MKWQRKNGIDFMANQANDLKTGRPPQLWEHGDMFGRRPPERREDTGDWKTCHRASAPAELLEDIQIVFL
ncbi:transposase [Brevibacillus sp. IT-7CA2]